MSELVKDPTYRKYISTVPKLPPVANNKHLASSPPWVVYVQMTADGKWGKKEFWKYSKAFRFMAKALKLGVHDVALSCKRMGFEPPSRMVRIRGKFIEGSDGKKRQATKIVPWKPKTELLIDQEEHEWCMYCRRPTVFRYFSKHKRLPTGVDTTVRRCSICGSSERIALLPSRRRI